MKTKEKIILRGEALSQIIIMIISLFAFSFFIAAAFSINAPEVEAAVIPQGCCVEAKDGSICQNMNLLDAGLCDSGLIGTSCNQVENCVSGCCYNTQEGICSLNSPKEKCLSTGGNWTKNPTCNIAQCQLGCCVLGEEASITTTRECTKLSQEYNFEKRFVSLDSDGSCNSHTGLSKKGACLSQTDDYSGENNCKFTTKDSCKSADFREGYLCTAKELNTICKPSKNTTCVSDKDQVYYTDTCGNIANIYDSSKFNDEAYWTTIISSQSSCSPANKDCGNCDYLQGSRCYDYRLGKDTKPTYGDKVCRDLNCANGKKHGESWCISDYSNIGLAGVAPVGSRFFKGICVDGEISIEPCVDFNNEVCAELSNGIVTEAKCIVNDWRSCISANEKESYNEVKAECKKYNQCEMFLDIPGNEKYKDLPGFKTDIINAEQGSVGNIGKDANNVIAWCVPRYTPGMIFWNTPQQNSLNLPTIGNANQNTGNNQNTQTGNTNNNYGGSLEETKAICSLGSFTCVSHMKKDNPNNPSSDWEDKENPECNINSVNQASKEKVPILMDGLNERCKSLGPCGISVNIAGELGSNEFANSTIKRTLIDEKGKSHSNYHITGYELTEDYLSSLAGKAGIIKSGSLTSLVSAVVLSLVTGKITAAEKATREAQAAQGAEQAEGQQLGNVLVTASSGFGALAGAGNLLGGVGGAGAAAAGGAASSAGAGTITFTGGAAIGSDIGAGLAISPEVVQGVAAETAAALDPASITVLDVAAPSSAPSAGISGIFPAVLTAAAAAAAGYFVGQLVGKKAGMTPGETQSLSYALAAGAGISTASIMTFGLKSCSAGPHGCFVGLIIAAVVAVVLYMFTGSDNKYYIMEYNCEPWSPPEKGDCNSCNKDIRTCSEYRCKSLGLNCQYYNQNGEPGVCAEFEDTASATIKPWKEALTEGNKYTEITETHFKIERENEEKLEAWKGITFGIITDKYATCKIDNKHTSTYDEMSTQFTIDETRCENGKCSTLGTNHKVSLSAHIGPNVSASSTLSMQEGENNYYIRCKNYAGSWNRAEFAVKLIMGSGPDLTPPIITRFVPETGSYVKLGENSSSIMFYVNEPSECKYSQSGDMRYEDMNNSALCITDESAAILGQWQCYVQLKNLTIGENKFYFQCKDQPSIEERSSSARNINRLSKQYGLNLCSVGLNITSIEPKNKIISGKSPVSLEINVKTAGCIENGKSTCYYNFENNSYISFFNTNSNIHKQLFTSLTSGNHNISIKCQDEAGNIAQDNININVELDNNAPIILRHYDLNNKLIIETNENSKCKYTQNASIGCGFDFATDNVTIMSGIEKKHDAPWNINKEYFIKCSDNYDNINSGCAMIIRAY